MEQRIWYTTRSVGGVWSIPITISTEYCPGFNPSIAVTSQGDIHAVWDDFNHIWYVWKASEGDWSEPIKVDSSQWYSWVGKVAADGEGNVYVVWIEEEKSTLYFSARSPDGFWSEPDSLGGTTTYPGRPWHSSIVVDVEATLHLAWDRRSLDPDISYMYRTSEGSWSEPSNVSNTAGASLGPSLAVDAQGAVHIAWGDNTPGNVEIYYDRIE